MIDKGIVGMSWICLPPQKWTLCGTKSSHCQLEVDVDANDVQSLGAVDAWSKSAPLRILSFDIECAGRKGHFPSADLDPVIQIASVVCVRPGSSDLRVVYTLGSCAPIAGAVVKSFETEAEMLTAWREFFVRADPDIVTGYNINNFDFPYLIERSEKLGIGVGFAKLGRLRNTSSIITKTTFSSQAYGTRESKSINLPGRVVFDVFQAIQREYKLRSYSLNAVSEEFLGEQKEDVHHSIIGDLFRGDAETRRRLASYCLTDALLPVRLLDKLMILVNYTEMARVTGVPLRQLLERGQQVKVLSQLYRSAAKEHMLIPLYRRDEDGDVDGGEDDDTYEGATVIEPVRGYYEDPIATLDFASLYPSIIMAHNLCYSTLLSEEQALCMNPDDYSRTPAGAYFIKV